MGLTDGWNTATGASVEVVVGTAGTWAAGPRRSEVGEPVAPSRVVGEHPATITISVTARCRCHLTRVEA